MSGQLSFKSFPLINSFHRSKLEIVYLKNFIVVNQAVLRSKNWKLQASVSRVITLSSTCLL